MKNPSCPHLLEIAGVSVILTQEGVPCITNRLTPHHLAK